MVAAAESVSVCSRLAPCRKLNLSRQFADFSGDERHAANISPGKRLPSACSLRLRSLVKAQRNIAMPRYSRTSDICSSCVLSLLSESLNDNYFPIENNSLKSHYRVVINRTRLRLPKPQCADLSCVNNRPPFLFQSIAVFPLRSQYHLHLIRNCWPVILDLTTSFRFLWVSQKINFDDAFPRKSYSTINM